MAVDGKTSRGARRGDGTRVHLLGVTEHGGRLLDHLEVDAKHNETSHFAELLEPLDLAGAVVTFDALHTVRANLEWLAGEKKAQYIAVVKANRTYQGQTSPITGTIESFHRPHSGYSQRSWANTDLITQTARLARIRACEYLSSGDNSLRSHTPQAADPDQGPDPDP